MEFDSQVDALEAVLSSIPEELFHEIELEVHNAEGAATNKQRLEVLREQQELIDEENEQQDTNKDVKIDDRENIDEKDDDGRQEAALAAEGQSEEGVKAGEAQEQGEVTDVKKAQEIGNESKDKSAQ